MNSKDQTQKNKDKDADSAVVKYPAAVLRKKAELLSLSEISSPAIKKLIKKMAGVLVLSKNGVGLAAPQVGVSKALFIIPVKLLKIDENPNEKELKETNDESVLVFINPRIIKSSKKKEEMFEGCLSTPNLYGKIKRSRQVTIEAFDENGKKTTRGAGGLLAEVFQHEIDHLNGKLFIDEAEDIQKYEPPN